MLTSAGGPLFYSGTDAQQILAAIQDRGKKK